MNGFIEGEVEPQNTPMTCIHESDIAREPAAYIQELDVVMEPAYMYILELDDRRRFCGTEGYLPQ